MAVIIFPLQMELVKLKRIVKRIIVSDLASNYFYTQLRHILVVKLVVMPRLDKEMIMIQESLFVVHALMFQGLRWVNNFCSCFSFVLKLWVPELYNNSVICNYMYCTILYTINIFYRMQKWVVGIVRRWLLHWLVFAFLCSDVSQTRYGFLRIQMPLLLFSCCFFLFWDNTFLQCLPWWFPKNDKHP